MCVSHLARLLAEHSASLVTETVCIRTRPDEEMPSDVFFETAARHSIRLQWDQVKECELQRRRIGIRA